MLVHAYGDSHFHTLVVGLGLRVWAWLCLCWTWLFRFKTWLALPSTHPCMLFMTWSRPPWWCILDFGCLDHLCALAFDGLECLTHLGLLGRLHQGGCCANVSCISAILVVPLWGRLGNPNPLIFGLNETWTNVYSWKLWRLHGSPLGICPKRWPLAFVFWSVVGVFGELKDFILKWCLSLDVT